MEPKTLSPDDYTVGWICAISTELAPARAMLDEIHSRLERQSPHDDNNYILGSIGKHNVAIACLPEDGAINAAVSAVSMQSTFPNIKFGLMVGVGGGIPGPGHDIRLGDIVVSQPNDQSGGVIQYDMGKIETNGFRRTGSLNKPPRLLLAAMQTLKIERTLPKKLSSLIFEAWEKEADPDSDDDEENEWKYPGAERDILFKADFDHIDGYSACDICALKEESILERPVRKKTHPVLHYGSIASGNVVMKNAHVRDELAKREKVICFEMEAAGLMDNFPCLIIRGISDYSDTHKNKIWQPYAAAVAAAYAKKLLIEISPQAVANMDPVLKKIEGEVQAINQTLSKQEQKQQQKDDKTTRKAIEQWLSPLEFLAKQSYLINSCFPTGRLFLESDEFRSWAKGRPWHLRCYGAPGTGKTYLSSIVVEYLQKNYQTEQSPVICMYLSDKESKDQTAEALYGSLLKQFLQLNGSKPVPPEIQAEYEKRESRGANLSLIELKELFTWELKKYERVFLVVDAVNECSLKTAKEMVELELPKLCAKSLSLMVTSNEYDGKTSTISCDASDCKTPEKELEIYFRCRICNGGEFDLCQSCKEEGRTCEDGSHVLCEPDDVQVKVRATDEEIYTYVNSVINKESPQGGYEPIRDERVHPEPHGMSNLARKLKVAPDLREKIPPVIVRKAEGNFNLAKHYIDSLAAKHTVEQLRYTLDHFPDEFDAWCEERMRSVLLQKPIDLDLARKALWISTCACRPLTLPELQHALGIEPGEKELNIERDFDKLDILEVTKGLLTIDDGDVTHSFVRFFHIKVQGYLTKEKDQWFPGAETAMATACLTCLQYEAFLKRNTEIAEDFHEYPFVQYALQFWGDHVCNAEPDEDLEKSALEFVLKSDCIEAFIKAAWYAPGEGFDSWGTRQGVDAMHVCAWFGLSSLIPKLRSKNDNINVQETTNGRTPLIYACRRGHKETARQLLELGANINVRANEGKAALLESIQSKHEDVANLLLGHNKLDINIVDSKGRTGLMFAIIQNLENIAEAIASRSDSNVNIRDNKGYTALSLAANTGSIGIVKALLAKPDIQVNLIYTGGRSALMIAAQFAKKNETQIVQALLENGANPNLRDSQGGGSALSAAIKCCRNQIFEVLLEFKQTDRFCVNDQGQGLMHYAAKYGNCDILHKLGQNDLDVNLKDSNGFSPLHEAVQSETHRAAEIVQILLEMGADPKMPDNMGKTPVELAAECGNEKIMAILKSQTPGDDTRGDHALPIWLLAKRGRFDLITEALSSGKANLDEKQAGTMDGPLHFAVLHHDILRLLLEKGKMDPNSRGQYDCTPLHLAAIHGRSDAVKLLLEYHANIDLVNQFGYTPLRQAQHNKHLNLAITLIEAGATVDPAAVRVQQLFFAAVENGKVEAVKILLEKGANPMTENEEGLIARQLARRNGANADMISFIDSIKSPVFSPILQEPKSKNSCVVQ